MNIGLWLIILFAIWMIYRMFAPVKGLQELKDQEFQAKLTQGSKVYLVDVREEHEFQGAHIKGAVNIPLSKLPGRTHELPRDKDILLYCQSGMRSKRAAGILHKNGVKQMAHLRGGISAYSGKIVK